VAAEEPEPAPRRRGRRPGGEDLRAVIIAAARSEFAARGYDATTLRGIARVAGVDPRLVHHYFDGKDAVFAASLELPVRPGDVIAGVLAGGPDGIGERLVRTFLSVWDSPAAQDSGVALVKSLLSSESGARTIREFVVREIFGRLAAVASSDDAEFRAALVASQVVGLIMARYVVRIEPLASADAEDVVAFVAPTIQRYLTGD
jgi:AcrR family transcriptional regulator